MRELNVEEMMEVSGGEDSCSWNGAAVEHGGVIALLVSGSPAGRFQCDNGVFVAF